MSMPGHKEALDQVIRSYRAGALDSHTIGMARSIATYLDGGSCPKLLEILSSLYTELAKKAAQESEQSDDNPLTKFRKRANTRKDRAKTLDSST